MWWVRACVGVVCAQAQAAVQSEALWRLASMRLAALSEAHKRPRVELSLCAHAPKLALPHPEGHTVLLLDLGRLQLRADRCGPWLRGVCSSGQTGALVWLACGVALSSRVSPFQHRGRWPWGVFSSGPTGALRAGRSCQPLPSLISFRPHAPPWGHGPGACSEGRWTSAPEQASHRTGMRRGTTPSSFTLTRMCARRREQKAPVAAHKNARERTLVLELRPIGC